MDPKTGSTSDPITLPAARRRATRHYKETQRQWADLQLAEGRLRREAGRTPDLRPHPRRPEQDLLKARTMTEATAAYRHRPWRGRSRGAERLVCIV